MYFVFNKGLSGMKERLDKKKVTVIAIAVLVVLGVALGIMTFAHPLILKSSNYKVELKDKFEPKNNIACVLFGSRKKVECTGDVNMKKLGDYKVQYHYGKHKVDCTVTVQDTKAPELEVKEYKTDCVEKVKAESFVDKLKDNDKAKVKISDTNEKKKAGEYKVTIVAFDPSGNETSKEATLVREKDTKAPVINDMDQISVLVGEKVDLMADVSAKDDFDASPKITVDEGGFDQDKPGTYTVKYTATDRSGNSSTAERTVIVNPDETANGAKIVYLTFDDGPSQNTGEILDILNKYKIKATFFVTGCNQKYNYNIARAFKEGHTIGLHTYTHNYAIYASEKTYFNDLKLISDMVENLTGTKSHYIRFPGGSSNTVSRSYNKGIMTRLTKEVQDKGYKYYDWNCSSNDAAGNTMPVGNIVSHATACGANHINILFHDSAAKTTSVKALPKVIEYYKARGYTFKPISDGSYQPHHGVNN